MDPIKTPNDCESLQHIRQGIDHIDHQIIELLAQRMGYVLNAAEFKPDLKSIPAPNRVAEMLTQRKQWAEQADISSDFIVPLYSQIIQWFIQQQTEYWQTKNNS